MGRIEKYAELPCFSFDGSLARILAIESGSIAFLGAFSGGRRWIPANFLWQVRILRGAARFQRHGQNFAAWEWVFRRNPMKSTTYMSAGACCGCVSRTVWEG